MAKKKTTSNLKTDLHAMFTELGGALAEVFGDPQLKAKAKELGKSAEASAKVFASRFHDPKVQARFKQAGKTAKVVGAKMGVEGKKFGQKMEKAGRDVAKHLQKTFKK